MTIDLSRAQRAIDALRKPDASLQRVPNTIRQSIAEVIEDLVAGHHSISEQIAAYERLGTNESLKDQIRLLRLLNGRDDFIVSKGLWSEFVDSLPRTASVSGSTEGGNG